MGVNTRLEKSVAQTTTTPAAVTMDAVDVTFTANAPTPSNTQTIADGDVPTVAELGQWVANQEVVCEAAQTDITNLRASIVQIKADLESLYAVVNAGE